VKSFNNGFSPSIAIVSNATHGGGAEKSMMALHNEFIGRGLKSNLIALNTYLPNDSVPNVIILSRNWKSGIMSTVKNYFKFKKTIKDINPNVIIVNCELPELYISFSNFKGRKICVEHTTIPWHKKRNLGRLVLILLKIKKTEWVTVVKGQNHIWFARENINYIPNPYIPISKKTKISDHNPSLTFIGGMKENKRPEWVIKAGVICNLKVHVYGEGPLRNILETKYKSFSENLNFYGYVKDPWQTVSSNSLVVIPSEFEGDGMVVMETILFGNPIVLARNEDLLRFGLEDKHYFKNINELYAIIDQYKKNHFKELVALGDFRGKLKSERSIDKITDKWLELIREPNMVVRSK
jgi:glycosyltransferase involved in cell wall biosynthesis